MTPNNHTVEKIYEEFKVKEHSCSLDGLIYESEELTFKGINFNSGFLSFEKDYIDCSIGTTQLKNFSKSNQTEEEQRGQVLPRGFTGCKKLIKKGIVWTWKRYILTKKCARQDLTQKISIIDIYNPMDYH